MRTPRTRITELRIRVARTPAQIRETTPAAQATTLAVQATSQVVATIKLWKSIDQELITRKEVSYD